MNETDKLWIRWKKFAERLGNLQATIIFSILYFILVAPIGIISPLFSDFLNTRSVSGWRKVEDNTSTREKLGRQ